MGKWLVEVDEGGYRLAGVVGDVVPLCTFREESDVYQECLSTVQQGRGSIQIARAVLKFRLNDVKKLQGLNWKEV